MRKISLAIALLVAVCAYAGDGTVHKGFRPRAGRYIVILNTTTGGELADYLFDIHKVANAATAVYTWNNVVRGFALDMTATEAQVVARLPFVQLVEEDSAILPAAAAARSWNTDRIDNTVAPRLDSLYTYCETGAGVFAYVVDTGVWAGHDEFSNQDPLWPGQPRVRLGWDFQNAHNPAVFANVSNDPCPRDGNNYSGSHGTAVASVLAGRTLGAAPEATIVPVRFLDCNAQGFSSDLIAGLNWIPNDPNWTAAQATRASGRVVNMSQVGLVGAPQGDGSTYDSSGVELAVQGLLDRGITVVAAAGNFNEEIRTRYVPARMAGIITVAGTRNDTINNADVRWNDGPPPAPGCTPGNFSCYQGNPGSNYGPVVDVFAPADRVLTAHWSTPTATRDANNNSISSGTSFAAPLVAGVAARWLQNAPGLTCAQVSGYITTNALSDTNTPGFSILDRHDSPNLLIHRGPLDGCRRRP